MSLLRSILLGIGGFVLLSLLAFTPWIFGARWFAQNMGAIGLYLACLAIYLGLSAPLLHRLIKGEHTLGRFYRLFAVSFGGYAVCWILAYLYGRRLPLAVAIGLALAWLVWTFAWAPRALRRTGVPSDIPGLASAAAYLLSAAALLWWWHLRHVGDTLGLFLGCIWMAWTLARSFGALPWLPFVAAVLFLTNVAGYFSADWLEHYLLRAQSVPFLGEDPTPRARLALAMPLWGVLYGVGFGAGLGAAFWMVQRLPKARAAGE